MSGVARLFKRRGEFKYVYQYAPNLYDAAVAVATTGYDADSIVGTDLEVIGVKTERILGESRWKRGRTTEATTGRVFALDVSVEVGGYACGASAYFVNQVAIVGSNGPFSAPGDSGSLVCVPGGDGLKASELLFAGGTTADGQDITIASPIEFVIEGLGYKIP
jgi:hypothetical protein